MAGIEVKSLTKSFGPVRAVDAIDLNFGDGKFVCLLGPSGCGKTTLLRLIAGLETPTAGDIWFNGEIINDVPPHKRDFGMVFQSLALFPHLSVGENIAYALKIRNQPKHRQDQRIEELLDMVHLPGIAQRRISQLSGGQRQRVAIARALAIEPRLFLLDEPLSALDAKLREAMQVELRQLQQSLGVTTIVVTHDQREAMTMADHVVIMKDGQILQSGAPLEIYRNPANAFVADFIGTSNLVRCKVLAAEMVEVGGTQIAVEGLSGALKVGDLGVLTIRPEDLHISPQAHGTGSGLSGKVTFIRDLGAQVEIMLNCAGHDLIAMTAPKDKPDIQIGDLVQIGLPAPSCKVVPA